MKWKKGQYLVTLHHGSAGSDTYGYVEIDGPQEEDEDDDGRVDWGRMDNPTETFVGAFDSHAEAQKEGRKAFKSMRLK